MATRLQPVPAQPNAARPGEADAAGPRMNLTLVYRDIGELVTDAGNARTHTGEQVAQIAASIREWGWTNPILIDETATIIAGHGRLEAARLLALKQVPTITIEGLSDKQRQALNLADNKL